MINKSSSGKKRRFQCRCGKSWGCESFVEDVIAKSIPNHAKPVLSSPVALTITGKRVRKAVSPHVSTDSDVSSLSNSYGSASDGDAESDSADDASLGRSGESIPINMDVASIVKIVMDIVLPMMRNDIRSLVKAQVDVALSVLVAPSLSDAPSNLNEFPSLPAARLAKDLSDLPPAAPSPSRSPLPQSASEKYTTMAERLRLANPEETRKVANSIALLKRHKPLYPAQPIYLPLASPLELKHKVRRIYVKDLVHARLKDLKKLLFDMRFRLSKIVNLSYISKTTVEFLVLEDYEDGFRKLCRFYQLSIMDSLDPSEAQDRNASAGVQLGLTMAFRQRLARQAAAENDRPAVREYFREWLSDLPPLPTPPVIASTPASAALVSPLSDLPVLAALSYPSSAEVSTAALSSVPCPDESAQDVIMNEPTLTSC
jgi:hypothetical protein